jgi:hypothetical protein
MFHLMQKFTSFTRDLDTFSNNSKQMFWYIFILMYTVQYRNLTLYKH